MDHQAQCISFNYLQETTPTADNSQRGPNCTQLQTDRQADRQRDSETDTQTDRQTERQRSSVRITSGLTFSRVHKWTLEVVESLTLTSPAAACMCRRTSSVNVSVRPTLAASSFRLTDWPSFASNLHSPSPSPSPSLTLSATITRCSNQQKHQRPGELILPTKKEVHVFARVCLSVWLYVCLLARLLKSACIKLDEMLRIDRRPDMDKLINFWARSRS